MDVSKVCTKCGVDKPLEDYAKQPGGKLGRLSSCMECKKAENRDAVATGRWHSFTPEAQRASRLLTNYGITTEQYEELWLLQDGKCAICSTERPGGRKESKWLAVDHDHTTLHVRGLLCETCNIWLGNFEELLRRAPVEKIMEYLVEKPTWLLPNFPLKPEVTEKTCTSCRLTKPIDEFGRSGAGLKYRKATCKPCESLRKQVYYATNDEYREAELARGRAKASMRRSDMVGEAHPQSKLTEQQVREIKASGKPLKVLAREYGVSRNLIRKIVRGEAWKHIA